MDYFDDAKSLIEAAKSDLSAIKSEYELCLSDQHIRKALLIKIKNFMENLRSALDYTAHGLFESYGDPGQRGRNKIYFPYAAASIELSRFRQQQTIQNSIPGLPRNRPDIVEKLESYQHFASHKNSWFPEFMALNNTNKHQKLTPQEKTEIKQLSISSPTTPGIVLIAPTINIDKDAEIRLGDTKLKGSDLIPLDRKGKVKVGDVTQEVSIWISFRFKDTDIDVYPFLERALVGIEQIIDELSKI